MRGIDDNVTVSDITEIFFNQFTFVTHRDNADPLATVGGNQTIVFATFCTKYAAYTFFAMAAFGFLNAEFGQADNIIVIKCPKTMCFPRIADSSNSNNFHVYSLLCFLGYAPYYLLIFPLLQ